MPNSKIDSTDLLTVGKGEVFDETEDERTEREFAKEMFDAFGEELVVGFGFSS